MAFVFKQYIAIGQRDGFEAAISALASEMLDQIKEY